MSSHNGSLYHPSVDATQRRKLRELEDKLDAALSENRVLEMQLEELDAKHTHLKERYRALEHELDDGQGSSSKVEDLWKQLNDVITENYELRFTIQERDATIQEQDYYLSGMYDGARAHDRIQARIPLEGDVSSTPQDDVRGS
ncbi:MAG: hypothetical protein Q9202_007055 [Teloschistes flavicans]